MSPIVHKEFRDAVRDRWVIGYTLLLAGLGLVAAVTGMRSSAGLGLQMFGRTTATLTNLCLMLAPLIALSMGAASIARERDEGTLEHLLAQPIDRNELLFGKYVGLLLSLWLATVLGFLPAGVMIAAAAGPGALGSYLLFPMLAGLLIAATLGVGLLISVHSRGGVQAQGRAIMLWFVFVLLYDLLLIGTLVSSGIGAGLLTALLLLNPVDAGRVLVVLALEPDLYLLGPAGALLVGELSTPGTTLLLLTTLLAWTFAPLGLAAHAFRLHPEREAAEHPPTADRGETSTMKNRRAPWYRRRPARRSRRPSAAIQSGSLFVIVALAMGLAACGGGNGDGGGGDTAVAVTPEILDRGKELYVLNCAPCHGESGKGDGRAAATLDPPPRDHTDPEKMEALTDRKVAETIQKGGIISGYPNMPSHPHLRGDDLVAIVAFVRSLHRDQVAVVDLEGLQ